MADKSKIEWTGATWNPVTGCDTVSEGCDHCYARALAPRLKAMGNPSYQTDGPVRTSGLGFGVALHPAMLDQPLWWTKPRRIFVNSMSDLFHDDVPSEFIAQVFGIMGLTPRHSYQILTKRPRRMMRLLAGEAWQLKCHAEQARQQDITDPYRCGFTWPLPNVWLGVSVENQRWAEQRIPLLLQTPAAVRFLSCEPLLGPISLVPYLAGGSCVPGGPLAERSHQGIDWVIVGGESGPAARRMDLEWARDLVAQCERGGVACFVKQLGARYGSPDDPKGSDPERWPAELRVRQYPDPLGVAQGTLL